MQVSAVSINSSNSVFNTKASNRNWDSYKEANLKISTPKAVSNKEKQSKLFDSINEWKNFCHAQIEKGNLDVII